MVAYFSLAVLVVVVLISYFTNVNAGVLGILFAFVTGVYLLGSLSAGEVTMTAKNVIAGWPNSTIMTLMGMTFLFGIAKVNGTLENVAKFIVSLVRGKRVLLPFVFFLLSAVLSYVGPGPVVMVAIIAPITLAAGGAAGISDEISGFSTITGCLAGGLNKITPSGVIAYERGMEVGVMDYNPVFLSCMLISIVLFACFFVFFGGLKLAKEGSGNATNEKITFDKNQTVTLVIIAIALLLIMILKTDTALTGFAAAAILLVLKVADQKKSIAAISWNTILLVGGMGMLVNVVSVAGGIDALTAALATIAGPKTAAPIMSITASLMSAVSSASGVVMPTLIPTIPGMVEAMGGAVSNSALLSAIVVGAHLTTISPMSTLGAMTLGATNEGTNKEKFFTTLLIGAIFAAVFGAIIGGVGLFYLGG